MRPDLAWQASLFDDGPVGVDTSFAHLRRIGLDDRSWVDYCPEWLAGSDEVFALLLQSARWQQREVWMYERRVPEPRLTAGWQVRAERSTDESEGDTDDDTDDGALGRTGVDDFATPPVLREVANRLSERYRVGFDSIWVNLYRDGRDGVAWHGDRNARTQVNPLVATVSLGGRRAFLLRPRAGSQKSGDGTDASGRRVRLDPGHGDLVVMGGACQHDWLHTVPKTTKPVAPRMSVTIRHSVP